MNQLRGIDLTVLIAYLTGVVGLGCWLSRKSSSTEQYVVADRCLPAWAIGLSIFGSYISSISFLANPGKAFSGNWNPFVFSLATPLAACIAAAFFVPVYRRTGHPSAYHHLELRFGNWARTYAVLCFLLTQLARTGTIIYLLALAVAPLLDWKIEWVIIITGVLITTYTMFGGMEAVIWVGVVNSIILLAGPIVCLVALFIAMPEGPSQIVNVGMAQSKFSLGEFTPNLGASTFWVVLTYGLVINLSNFAVDQSYVQRYITARSNRAASQSVLIGALLYVPIAALFFFIGTGLFALHQVRPEIFPSTLDVAKTPDKVFPFFIVDQLPAGLSGLVIAAIFAAAMDSSLNSMATLSLYDIYKRYFRPEIGDHESMRILWLTTLGWGVLSTIAALAMTEVKSILDVWWELAGVFNGGLLGLFLLGLLSKRASNRIALTATLSGIAVIMWLTFSTFANGKFWPAALQQWKSPFHPLLTTVIGTLIVLTLGLCMCLGKSSNAPGTRQPED